MVEPNKTCEEGYYCRRSAKSGTPDQGVDANICPEGHYCPNGTGEPSNCPKGTLNNRTGMVDVFEMLWRWNIVTSTESD
jgi:hypothetical protein